MQTAKPTSEPVVFFGSGPVAAKSLELLKRHTRVEAVVTKPSTERDMRAVSGDSPVYLVSNKAELNALIHEQHFSSRVGVLIDFGIIVSQSVIDSFELGIINSHFSILPEWRGADPITFAILSGQSMTGVSLMLLVAAMDEGPVIAYGEQPLNGTETTPVLTERLILLSDGLLKIELPRYLAGNAKSIDQEYAAKHFTHKEVSYSRKLTKDDGILHWFKPAQELEREIRAFAGWPKSRTVLADKDIVITKAHVVHETGDPGQVIVRDKELIIYCGEDALSIDTLKPAGKNDMTAAAFLAGHKQLL